VVAPVKKACAVSTLHISLPRDAASPGRARRQVGDFVTQHEFAPDETVKLVVSELVTNAVTHGADPIEICVRAEGDVMRVEVSDGDPDTSSVLPPVAPSDRPGGRGLSIVSALTSGWGTIAHGDGKTVWAEISREVG